MTARRVEVSRRYRARARDLYRAWTEPELVESWWGPDGFKTVVTHLDPRVGGTFRFEMISPSGARGAMAGVYREVSPGRCLVFELTEHCNCDLAPGDEPQLDATEVRVEFVEDAGETTVRILHRGLTSDAIAGRTGGGWESGLACLARAVGG